MTSRLAIIKENKCKPQKCGLECMKKCPVVQMGKSCIEVTRNSKIAFISEELCTGCNTCVKMCPFEAIKIINIPKSLETNIIHRYGVNLFKLHKLPNMRLGQIIGIIGQNGLGKSTLMKILGGKLKPNLGNPLGESWDNILNKFRGSELQTYFTKLLNDNIKVVIKPQYVDKIAELSKTTVREFLEKSKTHPKYDDVIFQLDLNTLLDRQISVLSGGELQRFAIASVSLKSADVFMFDEPTSYLDIKQRIKASNLIKSISNESNYILVIDHDLSVLDYLSDYVCCLYGSPSDYGVVSQPYSVGEGINNYLEGFLPGENLRFQNEPLKFSVTVTETIHQTTEFTYPKIIKEYESFTVTIEEGKFRTSEIIMILGENGTGKSTFIKELIPLFNTSYKPQIINPKFKGTVRELLYKNSET